MGKFINAKFQSACAETRIVIKKGDQIFFDGKAYSEKSQVYKENKENADFLAYIQANENAYFDNFCLKNNI